MDRIAVLERQLRHLAAATEHALPCPECGQAKFALRGVKTVVDSDGRAIGREVLYVCRACQHEEMDDLPLV